MILNRQRAVRVAPRPLANFLQRVKKELDIAESDVTVCFVSDTVIARMNRQYRKKNGPTDVLSFPSEKEREGTRRYLGDIAIAPETAKRYAKKNGRSLDGELRVLMLHGVLHLLGYDHETDRGQMSSLENRLRRRFGLA